MVCLAAIATGGYWPKTFAWLRQPVIVGGALVMGLGGYQTIWGYATSGSRPVLEIDGGGEPRLADSPFKPAPRINASAAARAAITAIAETKSSAMASTNILGSVREVIARSSTESLLAAAESGGAVAAVFALVAVDNDLLVGERMSLFSLIQDHEQSGDPFVLWRIGAAHRVAEFGLQESPRVAAEYYRRAADLGLAVAQHYYASMHFNRSLGEASSYETARRYFQLAADQGNGASLVSLGMMYMEGQGVARNMDIAIRYLERAAIDHNVIEANANLGLIYLNGEGGVPTNTPLALRYLLRAASAGDGLSALYVGAIYLDGHEGIQRNEQEAERWLRFASTQNPPWVRQQAFELLRREGWAR